MTDILTNYLKNKNLVLFGSSDSDENIKAMAKWLCSKGETVEIRLFQLPSLQPFKYKNGGIGYKNTYSVYANNEEDFIKLAKAMEIVAEKRKVLKDDPQQNKQATVCFSLQSIADDTAQERIEQTKNEGLEDLRKLYNGEYNTLRNIKQCCQKDIIRRRHLVIDLDPERESGIPSTEAEKDFARKLAIDVIEYLKWDIPLIVDSGNGIHLIYCIDLEESKETRLLIENFYQSLSSKLSNENVKIDSSLGDSSRCLKLAGTKNRKGIKPTPERPHRFSHIIYMPENKSVISKEQIQKIAELAPKKKTNDHTFPDSIEVTECNHTKPLPPVGSILFERNRFKALDEISRKIGIVADGQGRFEAMKKACSIAVSYLGLTNEAFKVVLEWNNNNRPPKGEKEIADYFNFMKERYNALPIGAKAETFIEDRNRIAIEPYTTTKLEFGGVEMHNKIADFLGIRENESSYIIPCFDVKRNISYIRFFDSGMKLTNTLTGSNNIGVFNGLKSICIMCADEITAYRIHEQAPEITILVLADNRRRIDEETYRYIRSCRKVFICFVDTSKDKIDTLNDFYHFFNNSIAFNSGSLKEFVAKNTSKDDFVCVEEVKIEAPEINNKPDTIETIDTKNETINTIIDDKQISEILSKAIMMVDDNKISLQHRNKLKELFDIASESEKKKPDVFIGAVKAMKALIRTIKENLNGSKQLSFGGW